MTLAVIGRAFNVNPSLRQIMQEFARDLSPYTRFDPRQHPAVARRNPVRGPIGSGRTFSSSMQEFPQFRPTQFPRLRTTGGALFDAPEGSGSGPPMSKSEEKPAIELNAGSLPAQTVTVVPSHEGEDAMGLAKNFRRACALSEIRITRTVAPTITKRRR